MPWTTRCALTTRNWRMFTPRSSNLFGEKVIPKRNVGNKQLTANTLFLPCESVSCSCTVQERVFVCFTFKNLSQAKTRFVRRMENYLVRTFSIRGWERSNIRRHTHAPHWKFAMLPSVKNLKSSRLGSIKESRRNMSDCSGIVPNSGWNNDPLTFPELYIPMQPVNNNHNAYKMFRNARRNSNKLNMNIVQQKNSLKTPLYWNT